MRLGILGSRIIYAVKLKRLLLFLAVITFCATNIFATVAIQKTVIPIVKNHAEVKAKRQSTIKIYNAVQEVIEKEGITYSDLYQIGRTQNGTISSIEINTPVVNTVKNKISDAVLNEINEMDSQKIGIPLGDVFNHLFFSGHGPLIPLKLSCQGFAAADFKSTFSAAGINQTRHSVSINVKTELSVVLPYDIMNVTVETEVPVTETVIVGNVPDLYLQNGSLTP